MLYNYQHHSLFLTSLSLKNPAKTIVQFSNPTSVSSPREKLPKRVNLGKKRAEHAGTKIRPRLYTTWAHWRRAMRAYGRLGTTPLSQTLTSKQKQRHKITCNLVR